MCSSAVNIAPSCLVLALSFIGSAALAAPENCNVDWLKTSIEDNHMRLDISSFEGAHLIAKKSCILTEKCTFSLVKDNGTRIAGLEDADIIVMDMCKAISTKTRSRPNPHFGDENSKFGMHNTEATSSYKIIGDNWTFTFEIRRIENKDGNGVEGRWESDVVNGVSTGGGIVGFGYQRFELYTEYHALK